MFWKPVWILLRFRVQAARNHFAQSPTPVLWTLLLAGVMALIALHKGGVLAAQWASLPTSDAETALQRVWLLMQTFWLPALLLPGVVGLLGRAPSVPTLRPFALRPIQLLAAEVLAALVDIPTFLALLLTLPLVLSLASEGLWKAAVVAVVAFGTLALQTGLLARGLANLGELGARRLRRWAEVPAVAVFLLFGLCVGLPPAFASLTSAPTPQTQLLTVSLPSIPATELAPLLPSTIAAHAVTCARNSDTLELAGALSQLMLCLGLTGSGALFAARGANRPFAANESRATTRKSERKPFGNIRLSAGTTKHLLALEPLFAVVVTEWRLLLRAPQNYLRLRKPASVLLLCVFGFLSPDMSRNPVYNLKEFLGIGALLYNMLWQMQLLCNRFGNEAQTGTLLFSFSLSRRALLLGRNVALLGLLLCLDAPALAGLCIIAGFPQNIPIFWLWLPMILVVLTALGNVLSTQCPFPISPTVTKTGVEPPDALAGGYICIGCLAALLLVPVGWLLSFPYIGVFGAMCYVSGLYVVSLYGTSTLLARREYQMIAALSG